MLDKKLITPPAAEPVSLAEVKAQCRIDTTDQDALVGNLITAARQYVEQVCGRQLVTATWEVYFDEFPCWLCMELPFGQLQAVSVFEWTDAYGTASTWTASGSNLMAGSTIAAHVKDGDEAEIVLAYSQIWPTGPLRTSRPIRIRYTCGYGIASAVPQTLKQAILMLVSHWYENREAVLVGTTTHAVDAKSLPTAFDSLIANYRLY